MNKILKELGISEKVYGEMQELCPNINELSDDEISAIEELRLSVRKEFLERRGDTTFEQETSEVLQYLHGLKKLFITNASKDKDDRIERLQKNVLKK